MQILETVWQFLLIDLMASEGMLRFLFFLTASEAVFYSGYTGIQLMHHSW